MFRARQKRQANREEYFLDVGAVRRRLRRRALAAGCVVLAAACVGGAYWLAARSAVFRVVRIEVSGVRSIAESDVTAAARVVAASSSLGRWLGPDNMLSWPGAVGSGIAISFPETKGVTVERRWGARTVAVMVAERVPAGIFCAGEMPSCLWFDDGGTLFGRAPLAEGSLIPVVFDRSGSAPSAGETLVAPRFVPHLFSVFAVLRTAGIAVSNIVIEDRELEEVSVRTDNGPDLRFSLRYDAGYALPVLRDLLSGGGRRFTELQYVDFRTENRAYYQ